MTKHHLAFQQHGNESIMTEFIISGWTAPLTPFTLRWAVIKLGVELQQPGRGAVKDDSWWLIFHKFTNQCQHVYVCVCVFRIARVHSLPWSFILIMANHCINGMFLIDARGLVMKSFVFFPRLEVVCCLWRTPSSSWVRSERPATKVRPRRSNWAGLHSSGRHSTRQFSASTKASRRSTSVRSTACWSLEAWTDWYACGTHISLGEEPELSGFTLRRVTSLKKKKSNVVCFLF